MTKPPLGTSFLALVALAIGVLGAILLTEAGQILNLLGQRHGKLLGGGVGPTPAIGDGGPGG